MHFTAQALCNVIRGVRQDAETAQSHALRIGVRTLRQDTQTVQAQALRNRVRAVRQDEQAGQVSKQNKNCYGSNTGHCSHKKQAQALRSEVRDWDSNTGYQNR